MRPIHANPSLTVDAIIRLLRRHRGAKGANGCSQSGATGCASSGFFSQPTLHERRHEQLLPTPVRSLADVRPHDLGDTGTEQQGQRAPNVLLGTVLIGRGQTQLTTVGALTSMEMPVRIS